MKKLLFFVALFVCFAFLAQAAVPTTGNPTTSKNSTYFSVDDAKINAEMAELNALESHVLNNEGTTYSKLTAENNSLVSNAAGVNGLGVDEAFKKGGGLPTWALVLIIVGGVLVLLVVLCCVLGSLSSIE
ncbi:MAG: hypothetical protein RIR11_1019 [Bacteroidota bacterium]|jgi:hypothetical protein